jgi:hypothetical protein
MTRLPQLALKRCNSPPRSKLHERRQLIERAHDGDSFLRSAQAGVEIRRVEDVRFFSTRRNAFGGITMMTAAASDP